MRRAGRRCHLIHLLKPTQTQGAGGEKIITHAKEHECFAGLEDIKHGSLRDRDYKEGQDVIRGAKLIPFDYYPDFTAHWRILHVESNVTYEVINIENPQGRNIEIHATCVSLTDV